MPCARKLKDIANAFPQQAGHLLIMFFFKGPSIFYGEAFDFFQDLKERI
jgi:hypothetical protein